MLTRILRDSSQEMRDWCICQKCMLDFTDRTCQQSSSPATYHAFRHIVDIQKPERKAGLGARKAANEGIVVVTSVMVFLMICHVFHLFNCKEIQKHF